MQKNCKQVNKRLKAHNRKDAWRPIHEHAPCKWYITPISTKRFCNTWKAASLTFFRPVLRILISTIFNKLQEFLVSHQILGCFEWWYPKESTMWVLLTVLEITVSHRTLSDQISRMSYQFHIMIGHDYQTSRQHILSYLLQGIVSQ